MLDKYFAKKRRDSLIFCAIMISLTLGAIIITEYDVVKGFTSIVKAAEWTSSNFYPDEKAMNRLPDILDSLTETVLVSIAATTVAALFALLFAMLGSSTTGVSGVFSSLSRGVASLFRNIDVAAWSMILLFSFGQNVLTGYFALFFGSFGFLTRAFMEAIDEVSSSSVEALRATGASYFSIIFQSVIPTSVPLLLSWILFMVETNIRHATIVGILTGTGIGFLFSLYYKSLNYSSASLLVIVIVITILLIEYISNYIRRVIL
ncbi:ABC transporter permease subunit [Paenibacillus alkaliterrae]|uniref:PhnE/PtxC family ABC transporter permease n=1 Tax=Paenibacillus alkaliterrae TaxID=320909 RepID=UPI001F1CE92A|nr:ABC transporter permease subunit [Paenibacillus alkaliterrae]MCF2940025.1 ABC transporter permease subunit [Paenibacillus alkaliterrae]